MKKAFTLIEMLVTVMIVALIATVSVLSLGSAKTAETVTTQGDELEGLIDELKSYAAGNDRDRAGNYILIIQAADAETEYCNKGITSSNKNKLTKNQYMICETQDKDISTASLTDNFNRVRAGGLNSELTISSSDFSSTDRIVINIRTFDGQMGYDLKYCDSDSTHCVSPEITLEKGDQTQKFTFNSILGTFK